MSCVCGHASIPGALLCDGCGAPLLSLPQSAPPPGAPTPPQAPAGAPLSVFAQAPMVPSFAPSPPPAPPSPAAPAGFNIGLAVAPTPRRLSVMLNGERQTEGFRVPDEGGALTLGRHDLAQGRVVDVDLRRFVEEGDGGSPVSRDQARLYRDGSGLWIEHRGRASTLWRAAAVRDFSALSPGHPQRLSVGDRLFFGTSDAGVLFELE